jgi:hypothetical protein
MKIITGRISGLLNNSAGEIDGIILDNGRRVRFSPNHAEPRSCNRNHAGSRVEVELSARNNSDGDTDADAFRIVNLDSQQLATLYASPSTPTVNQRRRPISAFPQVRRHLWLLPQCTALSCVALRPRCARSLDNP